jgi:outer membrane protein assembly factor BamB
MGASCILVLFGAVLSLPSEGEWPSWRGGHREGRDYSSQGPLHWSPSENIRWKATIPGAGCSSPIIYRGHLYVTTSYETRSFGNVEIALTTLSFLLLSGIAFFTVQQITERCCGLWSERRIFWALFTLSTIQAALILLVVLVVWGSRWLDYDRCYIRGWLGASVVATLCLMLGSFDSTRSARAFALWGLGGLLLALGIYFGVPCKDHVFRGGLTGASACVVTLLALVPGCAGACWLGHSLSGWWNSRNGRLPLCDKASPEDNIATSAIRPQDSSIRRRRNHRRMAIIASGVGLLAMMIAGYLLTGRLASLETETAIDRSGAPSAMEHGFWAISVGLAGLCFCGAVFAPFQGRRSAICTTSRFHWTPYIESVFVAFLLLIGGYFLLRSWVLRYEFLHYHLKTVLVFPWRDGNWPLLLPGIGVGFAVLVLFKRSSSAVFFRWRRPVNQCLVLVLATLTVLEHSVLRQTRQLGRAIVCIDTASGATLWHSVGLVVSEGNLHALNTPATPTPVVEGDRVVAYFGSAGLFCCNTRGQCLWRNESITFQSVYGVGVSLVAADGIVVLANMMPKAPRLYALSIESGRVLWSVPLDSSAMGICGSSRTPLIKRIRGEETILIWGPNWLEGYALRTGGRLWRYASIPDDGDRVASLVSDSERLYCTGPRDATALAWNAQGETPLRAVWQVKARGPNCASPLVTQGLLFFVSDTGVASCVEAETGRPLWQKRLKGEYYSSPIVVGDSLYFTNLNGHTTVVKAARTFCKLGENDLGESVLASPASVADHLYFRGKDSIICIGSGERRVTEDFPRSVSRDHR